MPNNTATAKLAPNQHHLTPEQQDLVDRILTFTTHHLSGEKPAIFTINGDCGTGKSVILSQLFYNLQQAAHEPQNDLAGTQNYFLVNHPEVLKVYQELAGSEPHVLKKDFLRPTSFINQLHKQHRRADVVVIDEAHLLLSQPDHYNNFYGTNQLAEILKLSRVVICVFDFHQVVQTKNYWDEARLNQIVAPYPHETYHLTHQFRMHATPALINWMDAVSQGELLPLPADARTDYDFRVYGDAESLRKAIVARNRQVGLSRVVATTGYPSTLDGGQHYINETGGFHMPWDQYNYTKTPWSEIPETINEVGSIYTCQGFDLNYVGLILSPLLYLDPTDQRIKVDLSKQTNREMLKRRADVTDPAVFNHMKQQIILNTVNVLLKRGIRGVYLYAHDPALRSALLRDYQRLLQSSNP
ncbi:DUF2075 domain-containing protein [Fructilactobacillus myrtifloralis]|uniref:DUF2075 domain-containing protein n=1 Tax=Fructilactobacillus myrtifloralis TaxID=2940301 RepID=A0ABY5BQ75_9LACO|nr:DUF2075 domain-containing protein [Fructilactobacillus myrtifloralis]USS84746.1 DUF2075 domain-containing protein [Fructilactobacillus myrtifloralis]